MEKNLPGLLAGLLLVLTALPLQASSQTPYSGQQHRDIKALSANDIDGYLQGRGMGMAKAAELNHYPGPKHVLELVKPLGLTSEQRQLTQALFNRMKQNASSLGQSLVEKERELNQLFVSGEINSARLDTVLAEIGTLQAKLRYVHLGTHLEQKRILSDEQVSLYDDLRGYGSGQSHHGNHHEH